MMRPKPIRGEPITGQHVRKRVELPDGRVLEDFPVFVVDPPDNHLADNKVQQMATESLGSGSGWVKRRRTA